VYNTSINLTVKSLKEYHMMKIDLIGVPFNSDGTTPEKENPAQSLRDYGLISLLSKNHVVSDHGDIEIPKPEGYRDQKTRILNLRALQETSRLLATKLHETLDPNGFSIVLGGDCAILMGVFGAFTMRNIQVGLLFFDGHADFHTAETSLTGEAADFELAFLTGRGPEEITNLFIKCPLISDEQIVAYGIREPDLIAESHIEVFDKEQMIQSGIVHSAKEGLNKLAASKLPLWLHFDVDVIDPGLVPVLFPSSNGLTFEQTQDFLIETLSSGYFLGMSVACYHPNIDPTGKAGKRIAAIISNALREIVPFKRF
jgi:arginase